MLGIDLKALALLLLVGTTYPFDFSIASVPRQLAALRGNSSHSDFINNCLLFVPLGFSWSAWLLVQQNRSKLARIFLVLWVGIGLSSLAEFLQLFLPTRFPSLVDVVANFEGTLIGLVIFCIRSTSDRGVHLVGLTSLVFSLSVQLQITTQLRNWEPSFPLLLGNEHGGARPWHGTIFSLMDLRESSFPQPRVLIWDAIIGWKLRAQQPVSHNGLLKAISLLC
jgi:VanZ family protein